MSARVTTAAIEVQSISFPTTSSHAPRLVSSPPCHGPRPPTAAAAPTSVTLVGPARSRTSCKWNEAEGTPLYLAPFVQHRVDDNCPFARWDTLCLCVPEVGGGFLRGRAIIRSTECYLLPCPPHFTAGQAAPERETGLLKHGRYTGQVWVWRLVLPVIPPLRFPDWACWDGLTDFSVLLKALSHQLGGEINQ